ncbi:uncharacterized protein LOC126751991 [Bactrocera neohumeralis]|uniref:uncharacterized protein LOC126751991 n=1 Tax=Bactrocera neohumeralis TaxID=98809 RepID=UPI002164F573|nr:uncharacterized protein LOC126751991 [Bactrocera neohumeralis]
MFKGDTMLLCYLLVSSQLISVLPQASDSSRSPEAFKDAQLKTESAASTNAYNNANNNIIIAHDENTSSNSDNNNNSGNKVYADEWSDRDKLLFYTLEQFALLSNFTVEHGTEVLRNVLKDAATLMEPTASLLAHLGNFSDYVARADNVKKMGEDEKVGELYDMVVLFTELVERHNTTALGNATTENMYLEMSLKKNGLDKLQVDFLERFLVFSEKFNARVDSYLTKLTAEQRASERKMIEWQHAFNAETDAEKKVEIFAKFFELYA